MPTPATTPTVTINPADTRAIDRVTSAHFLPYQIAWLNDPAPVKMWEKSRRIGADYTESYDAVVARLSGRVGRDYWYSSADESAAVEQAIYTKRWLKLFDLVYEESEGTELIDGRDQRVMSVTLPEINGRCPRMTFMTSSPTGFRSKGGDVCLSEFAHHKNASGMWQAASPTAMRGGSIRVLSTHWGEGSEFDNLLAQARRHADPATHGKPRATDLRASIHRTTIVDAVNDGLVENINRFEGTDFTRESFIADLRSRCGSEDRWLEEFMCVPSAQSASFFPTVLLRECVGREVPTPTNDLGRFLADIDARVRKLQPSAINMGCDVGRKNDRFVIWAWGRCGTQRVPMGALVYHGRDFADMETALNAVMGAMFGSDGGGLAVRRVCIDATGLGMQLAERTARRWRGRAEEVTFSAAVKEDIFTRVRAGLEERTVVLPDDAAVLADFTAIRREVTKAGNSRYSAEANEHGHADIATAAALGLMADETGRAMMRFVDLAAGGVL